MLINIIDSSAADNLHSHFTLGTKKNTIISYYAKQSMPYIPKYL